MIVLIVIQRTPQAAPQRREAAWASVVVGGELVVVGG